MNNIVRGTLWIVLALFLSTPAYAQKVSASADEAEVEFRLGNQAYRAGDYRMALGHYFASNRLVANRNVIFNIAKCYENLDEFVESYRYYQRFLETAKSEKEVASVQSDLKRIEKRIAIIEVDSEPQGATIYLNRVDLGSVGVTPLRVPVSKGKYTVILRKKAFADAQFKVKAQAGKSTSETVKLKQRLGSVQFVGVPAEVQVLIPGADAPKTVRAGEKVPVPVGQQTITVSSPGYRTQEMDVNVTDKAANKVEYQLELKRGTLVVQSTEINSAILLNGEVVGFTPTVVDVPVGQYQLSIRADGFAPYMREIEVVADTRQEVEATLQPASSVNAASGTSESVNQAPASVSLISSKEIEAFAYKGTADALSGTRGIYYSNDLTYRTIGINGYASFGQFGNRTLVQLDGHTLNDNWVEASYHEFELLSDIYGLDRIEVVRGPNSVLYGSGAFQGVVNYASPDPADKFQTSRVGGTALSDGTARLYAHVREPFEDGGLQLWAAGVAGQGRDFVSPARVGSSDFPDGRAEDQGDFTAYTLHARGAWKDFTVAAFLHNRDQQAAGAAYETLYNVKRQRESDTRGYLDLRYERDFDAFELNARAYYDVYTYRGRFPYAPEDGGDLKDSFDGQWGGLDLKGTFKPFAGARWTVGTEFVRHFQQNTQSEYTVDGEVLNLETPFTKISALAVLRQDIGKSFGIWAGARYDIWLFDALPSPDGNGEESREIPNINPRFVVIYNPVESSTIKGIVSRGFRAPSVYELTYNDGGFTQESAPDLDPESILTFEVEYTQNLMLGWDAVLDLYVNKIESRVEAVGEGLETDPVQFQNSDADLWTAGLGLELRRNFFKGWMLAGQYSLQQTREGDLSDVFSSEDEIPNSPAHLASLKVVVPLIGQSLNMANRIRYESPRLDREANKTEHVILWDLVFTGSATVVPVSYAFRIENLLDWRHSHPVGDEFLDLTLQQQRRTFILDLSVQF